MEIAIPQTGNRLLSKFRLTHIHDPEQLESRSYWPLLQPYFVRPYYRHLNVRLSGKNPPRRKQPVPLATRGGSGLGDLDVGYIADRHPMVVSISEVGLPDYCLTAVLNGELEYKAPQHAEQLQVTNTAGVIYRGLPGTRLSAGANNQRLFIRIPATALEQRLSALLGQSPGEPLEFAPRIDWDSAPGQTLRRFIWLLLEELAAPEPFTRNSIVRQSFTDLWIYALLQSLPHNYTDLLAGMTSSPVPRTVRRAEAFIRSHTGQPIALHEVAEAAGCSVRALQIGFRKFRDTTPAAAIRQARLEAARDALVRGEITGTVTDLALQFGFTNPARFTSLYKTAFGTSPFDALRSSRPRAVRP